MFDDTIETCQRIEMNACKLSPIHSFIIYSDSVNPSVGVKMVQFISDLHNTDLLPLWSYHQSQTIASSNNMLHL